MSHEVALGHNNVAGYDLIVPQPHQRSCVEGALRRVGADLRPFDDGSLTAKLTYNAGITRDDYQSLLLQFGLITEVSTLVTISLYNENETLKDYNATIIRPFQVAWRFGMNENSIEFVLVDCEEIP